MSIQRRRMVNEDYEPTRNEEWVIDVLEEGRANPLYLKNRTGLNDQQVNYACNQLIAAGWVEKIEKGLYELQEDPRDGE